MSLLFLVLLSPLPCVLGLPFYNGFYYSNGLRGRTLGNGYGEGGCLIGLCPGFCCDMQVLGWDGDSRIFLVQASRGGQTLLLR